MSVARRVAGTALALLLVAGRAATAAPDPALATQAQCPDPGAIAVLDGTLARWPRALADGALRIVALGSSSTAGAGATSPLRVRHLPEAEARRLHADLSREVARRPLRW